MAAYREPGKKHGKAMMQAVIDSVASGIPATLTEIRKLEHLRGSALGFRNLTNYTARSLLEAGGFRPRLHPRLG